MARKRMIDPEFWSDEEIGTWSHQARLFYIGLWNFADDSGRFKAHKRLLMSQIFPYDRRADIEKLFREIQSKVVLYEANGQKYGYLPNFLKYQRIDRPTKSKLPEPSTSTLRGVPANIREVNIREVKQAWPVYSETAKMILAGIYKQGFNIYKLMGKLKKDKGLELPEEVVVKVCRTYSHRKAEVISPWPWFIKAVEGSSKDYFATKHIKEHENFKKAEVAQCLKELLAGIGK